MGQVWGIRDRKGPKLTWLGPGQLREQSRIAWQGEMQEEQLWKNSV